MKKKIVLVFMVSIILATLIGGCGKVNSTSTNDADIKLTAGVANII